MPRVWRQRRAVQRGRAVATEAIAAHLDTGWLGIKRREKRFDLEIAG